MNSTNDKRWYVQTPNGVQGPFTQQQLVVSFGTSKGTTNWRFKIPRVLGNWVGFVSKRGVSNS